MVGLCKTHVNVAGYHKTLYGFALAI